MVFSTLYSFICLLFAYPVFSQDVVSVNSTETLLGALADQRVQIINLSTDIHGSDAVAWKEYKMLLIKRNVVIQSEGELKVLNFKYVPRRARLAAGKTLTFINLEVQGVQDSLDHRLLFLTHTKDAKVVFRSCRKQQAGCQALPKEEIVMRNFPRASVPGYTESRVQKVSLVNQTVHSRDAGKPLTYNGYVLLEDVVVPVAPGNDPTSVYTTIYQNTSKVCKRIADQECIDRFWITGCLQLLMNQDKDTDLLSQLGGGNQLADQPAYQSQRGSKTSMIAIAAIVPVVGVLLTALVVFWRLRSRRSGQGPSGVLDGTCPPGIRLGRMIGSGAYGQVYEGTWENKRVAVKIVVSHGGKAFTAVNEEAKFSLSFDHKNVVKCLYYTSSVRSCDSHSGTSGRGCRSGTAWTGTSRAQSPGSAYKTANSKSGPSHLRGHDVESAAEKDQEKQSCGRRGRWDAPHPMGLDRDHQVVAGSPGMAVFDLSSAAFQNSRSQDAANPLSLCEEGMSMQTWIVLELCELGPLSRAIVGGMFGGPSGSGLNWESVLMRARDVARGMAYLHSLHVCHGDLKPENVLLARDSEDPFGCCAKVADFGISRALTEGRTHLSTQTLGTVTHMSPELVARGRLGPQADVYSFGIMMWELVSGRPAYQGVSAGEVIHKVVVEHYRPMFPVSFSGIMLAYSTLAQDCWDHDPDVRPAFGEVLERLDEMVAELGVERQRPSRQQVLDIDLHE